MLFFFDFAAISFDFAVASFATYSKKAPVSLKVNFLPFPVVGFLRSIFSGMIVLVIFYFDEQYNYNIPPPSVKRVT